MILESPLSCSKIPLLVWIPSQINPVHALTPHLSYTVRVKYVCASFDSYRLLPIIVLNITTRLIFIKEKDCVLCEVRTKVLYMVLIKAVLQAWTEFRERVLTAVWLFYWRFISLPLGPYSLSMLKIYQRPNKGPPPPRSLRVHVQFTQSLHMPKSSRTDEWLKRVLKWICLSEKLDAFALRK